MPPPRHPRRPLGRRRPTPLPAQPPLPPRPSFPRFRRTGTIPGSSARPPLRRGLTPSSPLHHRNLANGTARGCPGTLGIPIKVPEGSSEGGGVVRTQRRRRCQRYRSGRQWTTLLPTLPLILSQVWLAISCRRTDRIPIILTCSSLRRSSAPFSTRRRHDSATGTVGGHQCAS